MVILKQRLGLRDTHTRPIFYDTAIARNAKGNSRNRTGRCGRNLDVLQSQGNEVTRGMLAGAIKQKENLEVKLKTLQHDIENRKDDVVDFKMMGIDHLFVDESHQFKTSF